MTNLRKKITNYKLRKNRVRFKIHGTALRPRMSVNISNMHISLQIIDDDSTKTLVSATSVGKNINGNMTEKATTVGIEIAKNAKKLKITKVVLDRGGRLYHGRIKAFAEAARKEGLEF